VSYVAAAYIAFLVLVVAYLAILARRMAKGDRR
jgi:hypothetical protein